MTNEYNPDGKEIRFIDSHYKRNMMMLYSPGTRSGLCEALTLMKEQLSEDESELFALADSVLRKVSAMDDAAFEKLNLYPD